ncbi:hypothetical protein FHEFKHOI_01216 [Candidatus Methanoperedenaceae archaeon GB50]|nr:MAG: hypothetical protein KBONHNOK_00401 [Candidatus Methanoperedenaceae archaeon GB50]CAD7772284.1 hypothetical protein AIOGIFDO_01208 [Candidatus Methanoperedenaceae archaeon GB37]CAD7772401.1 hypothetical protein FHEFKHOI_01216 [Candidatus Methanoperedenaceae archaeon GB50]
MNLSNETITQTLNATNFSIDYELPYVVCLLYYMAEEQNGRGF